MWYYSFTMGNKANTNQYEKMTMTPIPRLIVTLSIPTIISMLVTNIYNLVDTAFVGMLGTSASGAVGIVFGFMAILQAIGFLFGQGCGSIMSRLFGKHDDKGASRAGSTGFFGALTLSIIAEIICFIFLDQLIMLLGSTKTIAPYAKTYITYILIAAPFIVASFTMNNILRYEGKASLGMVGLLVGAILNMVGDPILMFVLDMGIAGAGLSTCLSQFVSFVILLSFFLRGKTICKLTLKNVVFRADYIGNIMATGLPSLIRQGLQSASTIILNMAAAPYGDAAISGMSAVSRITFFVFSVCLGIGQGFQPVSGFNYGASKFKRLRKAFDYAFKLATILIVVLSIVVFFTATPLVKLMRDDPEVINIGVRALKLQCLTSVFLPFCTMTEMLLQSTGKRLHASLLSSLKSGILFIPTLLLLVYFRGLNGIQEAQPVTNFLQVIPSFILALWYFRKLPKEDA